MQGMIKIHDFLSFVAFVDFVNDNDSNSDLEYLDEQNSTYLNNLTIKHENPIKKFLKNHDILDAQKAKIDLLNEERTNVLKKI